MQCDDDGPVERSTRSLSPQFAITKHGRSLTDLDVGLSLHQSPSIEVTPGTFLTRLTIDKTYY